MHVLSARQPLMTKRLNGFFHRVKRITRGGQHGKFHQGMKVFGQVVCTINAEVLAVAGQRCHGHAVHGQRARFVNRQHSDGPQYFHRRDTPCQDLLLRHTPSAQCQKHGEDDGDFLRQQSHHQSNAREQALQPWTLIPKVAQHHLHTGNQQSRPAQAAHQLSCALLQGRRWFFGVVQICPHAAHHRLHGGGLNLGQACAACDHGAGKEGGLVQLFG
jgi:hypothetical protein